jgi:hypothetical protein
MSVTLVRTELRDNAFAHPIKKVRDIIGLDGLGFNLMLEVKATAASSPPPFINVRIEFKEPHRGMKGMSSVPEPVVAPVLQFGATPTYRLTLPTWFFAGKLIPDGKLEFATVVRSQEHGKPATADAGFRKPLLERGWAWRGMSRQPKLDNDFSGSEFQRIPDAKKLMLAGGVETVEVSVPPETGLTLRNAATWGFIRNPADVFFYTGHGQYGDLVTSQEILPGVHDPWMSAKKLVDAWNALGVDGRHQFDIDILIINGCSVLNCESQFSDGMKWARLLWTRDGPLYAILGYRDGAPLDSHGGHAVAVDMAKRIARGLGWREYARAWLEVNRANHAMFPPVDPHYSLSNACAIDVDGASEDTQGGAFGTYWTLDADLRIRKQPLNASIPIL